MAREPRRTPSRPHLMPALSLAIAIALAPPHPTTTAGASADSPRLGAIGMPDPSTGSLLVSYYEQYLRDHDIDVFRSQVSARYLEGTLARLTQATDTQARRAAVFALGLVGSYPTNATVARALRDNDPTVRSLAENALWAIWFRADSPENNAELERVAQLISHQRFEDAIRQATRLIGRAPKFAEAYNQRAIAAFYLGRFRESADDCRQALERNPYHIGALSGLVGCLRRLDNRDEALVALRRASKLQPFNEDLRNLITALENGEN